MAASAPLDPYKVLLDYNQVQSLPTPTPLDLAEVPLVRAAVKLEQRDAEGNLPVDAYRIRHHVEGNNGVRYEVLVTGSPDEGMPYGRDGDVLQALFRIIATRRLTDGVLRDVSAREIARAMGNPDMNADDAQRIRSALSRFGHIIITSRVLYHPEQLALDILGGKSHPLQPDRGLRPREQEEKTWLLSYKRTTEYLRRPEGEDYIEYLAVNPLWVQQAVAGYAAWINPEIYMRLSRPIAKRLYELAAGYAARGSLSSRWGFDLHLLWSSCGISQSYKPSRVKGFLLEAASDLVEKGVLDRVSEEKTGRGKYRIILEPGIALQAAERLRGAGLLDLREAQILLMTLGAFGVAGKAARQLVMEKANQTYWAVCRAVYLRENPKADTAQGHINWGGRIVTWVRDGWAVEGDEAFQAWHERRLSGEIAERARGSQPVLVPPPEPRPGAPRPRVSVEPRRPEAAEAWSRFIEHVDTLGPILAISLRAIHPYDLQGTELVAVTDNDLWSRNIEKHIEAASQCLSASTQGRATALRVQLLQQDEG
jgi:hypothetical protein